MKSYSSTHYSIAVLTWTACHSEFYAWSILLLGKWDQKSYWINFKRGLFWENCQNVVTAHYIIRGDVELLLESLSKVIIEILWPQQKLRYHCWYYWEPSSCYKAHFLVTYNRVVKKVFYATFATVSTKKSKDQCQILPCVKLTKRSNSIWSL